MKCNITIEISPGELLDRISILHIKQDSIRDSSKLENINYELSLLNKEYEKISVTNGLQKMIDGLDKINRDLWDAIDDMGKQEGDDIDFVRSARAIYRLNDQRAKSKRSINTLLDSDIIEEKLYYVDKA